MAMLKNLSYNSELLIRHLAGQISFNGASTRTGDPNNTWILYFIGSIKYDTLTKSHTIRISFLPTSFFHKSTTACYTRAEIARNEVSFDISSDYAYDLVSGNEYDSDGYSFQQNNIFDTNCLQLAIHNAHFLSSMCLQNENIDYCNNVIAEKIKNSESRFLYYKSCITGTVVLIPCYEVARYFFFTQNMIVDMLLDGTLHFDNNKAVLSILSKYPILSETAERLTRVRPPNVALRILNDPLFMRTANLLSSKFKAVFCQMPQNSVLTSAFVDCLIPEQNPILVDANFVEVGRSKCHERVYLINRIVNVFEKDNSKNSQEKYKAVIGDSKPTAGWPFKKFFPPAPPPFLNNSMLIKINCKVGKPSYERNFTLNKNEGWWKPGMARQIILNKEDCSHPRCVFPLSRIITQKHAAEKEKQEGALLALKNKELEYESLSGYILRVLGQLRALGWNISYLKGFGEDIFIKEPAMLAVSGAGYKVIIAKMSIIANNGFSGETRTYSFYIFECLDPANAPHHIAIIHSLNLKPINIRKINKIVEKGKANKFFWQRCLSNIKALKLKLKIKSRHYDHWRYNTSAVLTDQYLRKSIKEVQAVERRANLVNCYPHLFKLDM